MRVILAFVILMSTVGCISRTVLRSSDREAEITVPGFSESGVGELKYHDRKTFWKTTEVQIKKEGCQTAYYRIAKADDFAPGAALFGLMSYGLGFLWTTQYFPEYELLFQCVPVVSTAKPETGEKPKR